MVDIRHKSCKEIECTTQPIFGKSGGKIQYCTNHKKDGMIDMVNKIYKNHIN
jgi:hypothetical protein